MEYIQQGINGLLGGSLYSLLALGFTLVFGVLSMINLAHIEVFMVSGFVALMLVDAFQLPMYVTFPLVMLVSAGLGIMIELICFRPVRRQFHFAPLVSTMALGMILSELVIQFIGSDAKSFPSVLNLPNLEMGEILVSSAQLMLLLISVLSMAALGYLLQYTKLGRSMRVLSENETAAKLLGVNLNVVVMATFVLSSVLASIAGMLYAIRFETVSPFIGTTVGLKSLAVMIIGGLGNIYGAMLGGILLGLLEVLAISLPLGISEYVDAVVWGALIFILLFRPSGLMGTRVQMERV